MIKALLFDIDGVVVNAEQFSIQYQKDFGVSPEKLLPFFKNRFLDCLVGKADLKEELLPHLAEWKWAGTVDEFLSYWFKSEHKLNEDLLQYIRLLKRRGIPSYVATNQEKYRTMYVMEEMGLNKIFANIFSSATLGVKKPNTAFFEMIAKKLTTVEKSEILFWDDTIENVEASKDSGIPSELYIDFDRFQRTMDKYLPGEQR